MSGDDNTGSDWQTTLASTIDSGGGCTEAWEASTETRTKSVPRFTRRHLLGSIGTVGALGLAGCQRLGPVPGPGSTVETDVEPLPGEDPESTDTSAATSDRPEPAEFLIIKHAVRGEDEKFSVQFIPLVEYPQRFTDRPIWDEVVSDELKEKQEEMRMVASEIPHELDTSTKQVRIYPDDAYTHDETIDPVLYLNLEQIKRLRNLMCEHEASIWAASVQQGQYDGDDGQFLFVGGPSDYPEFPCDEADTRDWIEYVEGTIDSEDAEAAPVVQGNLFWAPEWEVACTFVGWGEFRSRSTEDVALYRELNSKATAFVNRVRNSTGASSGTTVWTDAARSNEVGYTGVVDLYVGVCNEVHEPTDGHVMNARRACVSDPGDYNPESEMELDSQVPIVSTRGHYAESASGDNYRTEGHTATDYDTTGDVPVIDRGAFPDRLVVYVHGHFNSEKEAIQNFNRAYRSLAIDNDYEGAMVGFSWDSKVGKYEFIDSNWRAKQNGPKLGHFIADFVCNLPDASVHVVTHSLGARVGLEALQWLHEGNHTDVNDGPDPMPKLNSYHLMAAAIDETALADTYYDAIANQVENLYSYFNREDDILSSSYGTGGGGEALGEGPMEGDTPPNAHEENVTQEVGDDHSGYNGPSDGTDANGGADGIMDHVLRDIRGG